MVLNGSRNLILRAIASNLLWIGKFDTCRKFHLRIRNIGLEFGGNIPLIDRLRGPVFALEKGVGPIRPWKYDTWVIVFLFWIQHKIPQWLVTTQIVHKVFCGIRKRRMGVRRLQLVNIIIVKVTRIMKWFLIDWSRAEFWLGVNWLRFLQRILYLAIAPTSLGDPAFLSPIQRIIRSNLLTGIILVCFTIEGFGGPCELLNMTTGWLVMSVVGFLLDDPFSMDSLEFYVCEQLLL